MDIFSLGIIYGIGGILFFAALRWFNQTNKSQNETITPQSSSSFWTSSDGPSLQNILAVLVMVMLIITISPPPTDGDGTDDQNTEINEDNQLFVDVLDTTQSLPTCGHRNAGAVYFTLDTQQFQKCELIYGEINQGSWRAFDLSGNNGLDGLDGLDGADGLNGTDGLSGTDGKTPLFSFAESFNCSSEGSEFRLGYDENEDGVLQLDEIDERFDVCDGENGLHGSIGTPGANGSNGTSIATLLTAVSPGIECPNGGTKLDVGTDDNGDSFLNLNEIDHTEFLCNGADGANGSASSNTLLTRVSPPSHELNCTFFGRVVEHGLDDGTPGGIAQNGILETDEVDYTTTYCDKFVFERLTDINPNAGNSTDTVTRKQVIIGNTMFFRADDGTHDSQLWAYNFQNSTAWMISGPESIIFSSIREFSTIGTKLYIVATTTDLGLFVYETTNQSLWQIGEHLLLESSFSYGEEIYFIAQDTEPSMVLYAYSSTNDSMWAISNGSESFTRTSYAGDLRYTHSRITELNGLIYVTDNDGVLFAYDPANQSLWKTGPLGNHNTMPGAYSVESVGEQLLIRSASGVNLGSHQANDLWVYDSRNDSSWELQVDVAQSTALARGHDPTFKQDSRIYFWTSVEINNYWISHLFVYDSSNSSYWTEQFTHNGSVLTQHRSIIIIDDIMYFNAYDPGTPSRAMFAYNTINSTTWKISNMGYVWFAIDYESSFIFSGTGDAYGYEFWKASIVQQVTHS